MRSPSLTLVQAVIAGVFALSACKPQYPKCSNDDHCKEKGEVCINGQCQECRDDQSCIDKRGEGYECANGRCEEKPECRADGDCASVGEGLVCRGGKCVPECSSNEDCGTGMKCEGQKCVAECQMDQECGAGMTCENGQCVAARTDTISAGCRPMNPASGDIIALEKIHFNFDRYELTAEARSTLQQNSECLKESTTIEIVVEGHCDERGTQEYNLALGEKRANTVRTYLRNLGIDTSRMRTRSKGENEPECRSASESCFSKNRRVLFIQSRTGSM